jgi:hypothetical protein
MALKKSFRVGAVNKKFIYSRSTFLGAGFISTAVETHLLVGNGIINKEQKET